jgi:hypothetical protein
LLLLGRILRMMNTVRSLKNASIYTVLTVLAFAALGVFALVRRPVTIATISTIQSALFSPYVWEFVQRMVG